MVLDRALPFQRSLTLFNQQNPERRVLGQIVGGKESGGTAADNNDIV
jgi:hypothetical protein